MVWTKEPEMSDEKSMAVYVTRYPDFMMFKF
jgi:hypothetical protein